MASEHTIEFTSANFEQEVLQSDTPVLVDLWAEWCAPCKMIAPTVEELAEEYAGRLKVGSLDTDSNQDIAIQYNISAIPTLLLFKGGQIAKKLVGVRPKPDLKAAIDEVLSQ
jgi:thioredoxin 1